MMMRILRSDTVVKLANRLLRTYSPGLLSGSMLMGIMAGGPFSPWGQLTGGMGALLYPFPTGEAAETTQKSSGWKTVLVSQAQDRINHRSIYKTDLSKEYYRVSKHGHKVPNMLNIPEGDSPKGTGLPRVLHFVSFSQREPSMHSKASSWCFHFTAKMSLPFERSKNLVHVTILQPALWCGPRSITDGLAEAKEPFKHMSYILPQRYTLLIPDTHWINIVKNSKQTSH